MHWLANGIVPHVKHWSQSHLGTLWKVSSKECSFPNQRVLPQLVALGECVMRRRKRTCSPQFAWKPCLQEKRNGSQGPRSLMFCLLEAFVNKIFDQWKLCIIVSFRSSWLSQTIPKTRELTWKWELKCSVSYQKWYTSKDSNPVEMPMVNTLITVSRAPVMNIYTPVTSSNKDIKLTTQ